MKDWIVLETQEDAYKRRRMVFTDFQHSIPNSRKTKIEWTDRTWNPVRGCSRVSEGCRNCYAERMAARFSGPLLFGDTDAPFKGFAENGRWTGRVELIESKLLEPLHWRKAQRVFVNSMSDLFHENLSDDVIDRVFAVMALCPHITFQCLSKRAERAREYVSGVNCAERFHCINVASRDIEHGVVLPTQQDGMVPGGWPLSNVWLGVSVENQKTADERIPLLLQTPAAVRFVSYEPALAPVDFSRWMRCPYGDPEGCPNEPGTCCQCDFERTTNNGLDQVIVGGESGPGARPMHPDWARNVRDQCQAAGVPFFFKQWGEWLPQYQTRDVSSEMPNRREQYVWDKTNYTHRVGKKSAGRLLDGRTWNEMPEGLR